MGPDQVSRLTITRDMAIKALKHVEDGTYPPPDAPQEDLMAVQYLLRKANDSAQRRPSYSDARRRPTHRAPGGPLTRSLPQQRSHKEQGATEPACL